MEKKILFEEIKKTALLKGHFILRSGQTSTEYFDKYLLESSPTLLKSIISYLKKLIPSDTEILAGLEMGGIPLATALSVEINLPSVFVRKKAKEYGTQKIIEGVSVKNKRVCIIEDVITTGGQVLKSAQALREAQALVKEVCCVIHRGDPESLEKLQSNKLQVLPLFSWNKT